MSLRARAYLAIPALALLVFSAGCDHSKNTKKAATKLPRQATAPAIATAKPKPGPKVEEKLVPKADPIDALIARVEKEYQQGQANYTAGHLDAAKDNFDRAFDLLLESNYNIRDNERLQEEFDKLIENVHTLELAALQQGDGFTAQKAEPAPIDEANAVTFPVDPKIKAQAELEVRQTHSDLPLVLNDKVASYINYFSHSGRGYLERALVRAGRYEDMIRRVLKEEGVPQDLIYLAEAESGFHPLALSRAGARGMWQFMYSRAVDFGLKRNWWIDDRQDPEKSTRAAAKHLKELYNQFGDWYLAMAAYNSGPGNVQRAVQRTGYADFWELYNRNVLPAETKNYVPIIVAVTIMAKNPAQYGLDRITPDPPLKYDKLTLDYPVDLRLVAESVDTALTTMQDLNPALLRLTTPKEGSYELKIPAGSTAQFQRAMAAIPRDMRVWWRYHKVEQGETLSAIARQYKTTSTAIKQVNNLADGDEVRAQSKLIIPVTPRRTLDSERMVFAKRATKYKVHKGDTLLSVADDFGVPVQRLRRWNGLRGNSVRAGRILYIYRPLTDRELEESGSAASHKAAGKSRHTAGVKLASDPKPASKSSKSNGLDDPKKQQAEAKVIRHKVKAGESLASIADAYNTSVSALRRDNAHLSSTTIHPGDVVVIRQ